eukprot:scaffold243839_cov32-Tisochrysis_lutea.AAC.1
MSGFRRSGHTLDGLPHSYMVIFVTIQDVRPHATTGSAPAERSGNGWDGPLVFLYEKTAVSLTKEIL